MTNNDLNILYVFIDEGGNFDFSSKGTKYFTITSVSKNRPFKTYSQLIDLKYDLIELGNNIEYFHASSDRQEVRDKIYNIIKQSLLKMRIDSLIVEKRKTDHSLQALERFYPEMLGYLLRYVLEGIVDKYSEVIIITDKIPVKQKRKIIEKSIKKILKEMLPNKVSYKILHHDSKSNICLQIADYCNWAIYRKWDSNGIDKRSYDLIKQAVKSEFDIFESGGTYYY